MCEGVGGHEKRHVWRTIVFEIHRVVGTNERDVKLTVGVWGWQTGKEVDRWSMMDNFFRKYNSVLLDKEAIKREKGRLDQVLAHDD